MSADLFTAPAVAPQRGGNRARPIAAAVLLRPATLRIVSVALVLLSWQFVGKSRPYATSYPSAIANAAWHTTLHDAIPAFGDTMSGFWFGLALCIVIGIPLGLLMGQSKFWQVVLDPYVTIFYSLPFVALIPVLILLVGIDYNLRLAVVLLAGLFPIVINTYLGSRAVGEDLLDVGRAVSASRLTMVRTIIVPASVHYIFAGIRIAFGRSLIAIVIIEIEVSTKGVGHLLEHDALLLRINEYFVPLFYLGFFAMACNYLMRFLDDWFGSPWTRPQAIVRWLSSPALALRPFAAVGSVSRATSAMVRRRAHAGAQMSDAFRRQTRRITSTGVGRWSLRLVSLAAALGIWQAYADHVGAAAFPKVTAVASATYTELFRSGAIWGPLGGSVYVLILAFVLTLVIGIPVGLAMGRSRLIENVVDPYVAWLYGQPHAAFIPIMIVWFGFGLKMRLSYAIFSAVFIVIINTMAGVKNVDPELLATGQSFCASERQLVRTIVLPSAMPFIVAGARLAFSATWIGVVVAEILSTQSGLGGLINNYSNYYMLAEMMVPILFIMVISVTILRLTSWAQPRLTPWANTSGPARVSAR